MLRFITLAVVSGLIVGGVVGISIYKGLNKPRVEIERQADQIFLKYVGNSALADAAHELAEKSREIRNNDPNFMEAEYQSCPVLTLRKFVIGAHAKKPLCREPGAGESFVTCIEPICEGDDVLFTLHQMIKQYLEKHPEKKVIDFGSEVTQEIVRLDLLIQKEVPPEPNQ